MIDKETGERYGPGSHRIWKTSKGYKGKLGATEHWVKKENTSVFSSENSENYLKSGLSRVKEYLDSGEEPVEGRETVMESQVGFPGLNAYRTVEEYESEEGVKITERRTEIRVLGVPITLDYGKVKGDPLENDGLEGLVD